MPKYETHEVHLSELIKHYIADLPAPTSWGILAIDLIADVLVLKRELTENEAKSDNCSDKATEGQPS